MVKSVDREMKEVAGAYKSALDKSNWKDLKIAVRGGYPVNTIEHINGILKTKLPGYEFGFFTEQDVIQKSLRALGWVFISKTEWKRTIDPDGSLSESDMEILGLRFSVENNLMFKDLMVMTRPLEVTEKVRKMMVEEHNKILKRSVEATPRKIDRRADPKGEFTLDDKV